MDPQTSIATKSASNVIDLGTAKAFVQKESSLLLAISAIDWKTHMLADGREMATGLMISDDETIVPMAYVRTPTGLIFSRPIDEVEDALILLQFTTVMDKFVPGLVGFVEPLQAYLDEVPYIVAGLEFVQKEFLIETAGALGETEVADDAESGESVTIGLKKDDSATGDAEVSAGSDEDQSTAAGADDSDTSGESAKVLEMPHDESGKASDEVGTAPVSEDAENEKATVAA